MSKIKLVVVILICILLLPFMVNAEECNQNSIKIQSIALKDKSKYTEELSKTTFENNKINLDLKMYDVGDYIEYELKVKNDSDEKYYFDEKSLNINSDYFDYSILSNDHSNSIDPNTEKTIYLKVQYKKEVEKDKFFSGKYVSNNTVTLKSSNNSNSITNPLTNNNKLTIFLFILLIIQLVLYFTRDKRINKTMVLLLGILLPFEVAALCNFELDINSNITIGKVKPNPCTFNGELVQGAEYVNGQYTYRYMQEHGIDLDILGINWVNITNDGWGVILTDKQSTDDVTTKLCTSINEKPIVSMSYMFSNSKTSKIDLSSFDTSSVTNMECMFHSVSNVKEYDLSNFNTSKVTRMVAMFVNNYSLENINMDGWDLSGSLTGSSIINGMFSGSDNIKTLSMKKWKIPESFTHVGGNRQLCLKPNELEYIDVSNWDLSNTKDISGVFGHFTGKEIRGLDTWDTSNIENMYNVFGNNSQIESLDLSSWDTNKVVNMNSMFINSPNLKTIIVSDKFKIDNVTDSVNMFSNCPKIAGENGTLFNSNHLDKEYARIDEPGKPGYFTRK